VEVFHRGASFDQDSDSIVRVEANRLRRRLAEYYAAEGASHSLRITIPVGQYVPRFESVIPQPAADPHDATAPEPQPDASPSTPLQKLLRPQGPRPWWMVTLIVLVLIALGLAYPWLLFHSHPAPGPVATQPNLTTATPADLQFGPPNGDEIRILVGGTRSFVDHAGKLWSADIGFTGGGAGKGHGQIYLNGEPSYRIDNTGLVDHIVELCEKKAAEIESQRNADGASKPEPLEAAQ